MAEPLTPAPIGTAIVDMPSGLTPRPWARWFLALQEQVLAGGTEGPPGPQGEQGEPGPPGPEGPAGPTGATGSTGATGATGSQGIQGPQGNPGTPATLGPTLTTIEALTGALDTMLYFTGTDVAALTALTAVARTLLAQATQAAQRTALGLGTVAVEAYTTGTFTMTGVGFSGTAPSGTARYITIGKQCTLYVPVLTGTSNATTFTVTGLPAALFPLADTRWLVSGADNGTNGVFWLIMAPAGTISLFTPAGGGFTASGGKALNVTTVTYITV